jgi:hypothetical protein
MAADAKKALRVNSLRVLVARAFRSNRNGAISAASHIDEEQWIVFARTPLAKVSLIAR